MSSLFDEKSPLIFIVSQQGKQRIVDLGALTIDVSIGAAYSNGIDLELSKRELAILLILAQSESSPIAAKIIYEKVWGRPMNDDTRALRKAISRLRSKLSGSGYTVSAIRNRGYVLKPEYVNK